MAILDQLKLSNVARGKENSPVLRFRRRLIEAIQVQIDLAKADIAGQPLHLYAPGVTVYRAFTGDYPYGEIEPFTKPRFGKPRPLSSRRLDLPAWLNAAVLRGIAVDPRDRYGDVLEFAFELENGAHRGLAPAQPKKALYERNPLLFWKSTSLVLLLLLFLSLVWR